MAGKSNTTAPGLVFEVLEERIALSAGSRPGQPPAIAETRSGRAHSSTTSLFNAMLSLTDQAKGLSSDDRATGFVKLRFNSGGSQATIFGSLSNISNVSAIVLHLTPTPAPAGSTGGQTVAVLLKPGSGSGAVHHRTFTLKLSRFDLIGPLVGGPLAQLRDAINQHRLIVVVQTANGVDPTSASTPGALQPGNFPEGELSGLFDAIGPK